jgi:hypothetical protein
VLLYVNVLPGELVFRDQFTFITISSAVNVDVLIHHNSVTFNGIVKVSHCFTLVLLGFQFVAMTGLVTSTAFAVNVTSHAHITIF